MLLRGAGTSLQVCIKCCFDVGGWFVVNVVFAVCILIKVERGAAILGM